MLSHFESPLITRTGPLRRQDLRCENHDIRYASTSIEALATNDRFVLKLLLGKTNQDCISPSIYSTIGTQIYNCRGHPVVSAPFFLVVFYIISAALNKSNNTTLIAQAEIWN